MSAGTFAAQVQPHLTTLHRYAHRMARDPERADDLLQDTLERGYRKRALFQPGTDVRAWLLAIMRNVWISSYRRRAVEPSVVSLDAIDEAAKRGGGRRDATTDSVVETSVVDSLGETAILEIIAALPPDFRDVVMLADVHGTPYKEVAARLRIPVGSVCSRLSRARQRLRSVLRSQGHDADYLARAG
jgi:RNA polymerase sigma-70 factor (ECF subfamily)